MAQLDYVFCKKPLPLSVLKLMPESFASLLLKEIVYFPVPWEFYESLSPNGSY